MFAAPRDETFDSIIEPTGVIAILLSDLPRQLSHLAGGGKDRVNVLRGLTRLEGQDHSRPAEQANLGLDAIGAEAAIQFGQCLQDTLLIQHFHAYTIKSHDATTKPSILILPSLPVKPASPMHLLQKRGATRPRRIMRSEEHTSELQSPYVISYAV